MMALKKMIGISALAFQCRLKPNGLCKLDLRPMKCMYDWFWVFFIENKRKQHLLPWQFQDQNQNMM